MVSDTYVKTLEVEIVIFRYKTKFDNTNNTWEGLTLDISGDLLHKGYIPYTDHPDKIWKIIS